MIYYLEKALGLTREDGLTWMQYFVENLSRPMSIREKDSRLYWVDMKDEKNPVYPEWVSVDKNSIVVEKDLNTEELILDAVEYMKKKEGIS